MFISAIKSKMAADTDVVVVSQKRLVQDAPTTRYTNTKNFIGGGVSGVIMVALGHPLDTVKVYWCGR